MPRELTKLEPPFTNKRLGRSLAPWKGTLEKAYAFCDANGLELYGSDAPYQVAVIKGDGVQLLLYPHKSTTMNYHLRIRDEGSSHEDRATHLMLEFGQAEIGCSFSLHRSDANVARVNEYLLRTTGERWWLGTKVKAEDRP